jgi:hypothetical protein
VGDISTRLPVSGIEQLSSLLGDLQHVFGANVVDARDELDGSIVVDLHIDAGSGLKTYRRYVRERADHVIQQSRDAQDRSITLQQRALAIVGEIQTTAGRNRSLLDTSRSLIRRPRSSPEQLS